MEVRKCYEIIAESHGVDVDDAGVIVRQSSDPDPHCVFSICSNAFTLVEDHNALVDYLVVSPNTYQHMANSEVLGGHDTEESDLKLWGAKVLSDQDVFDDTVMCFPSSKFIASENVAVGVIECPAVERLSDLPVDAPRGDQEAITLEEANEVLEEVKEMLRDMLE